MYRIRYRGTKELECYLERYFENCGSDITPEDITQWEDFLDQPEQIIADILFGYKPVINKYVTIIQKIRRYYDKKGGS